MSRSYKKFPLLTDNLWGKSCKKGKQFANRRIRHKLKQNPYIDIENGNYYKKLGLDSWDLYEYKSHHTKQDTIQEWEKDQIEFANGVNYYTKYRPTLDEAILDWFLSYKRK